MVLGTASHGQSEPLSYDAIFDKEANSQTPQRVRWTEDGSALGFLLESEGEKRLELLERTSHGSWRMRQIAPHQGSEEISVDRYQWSPDGQHLLLRHDGDLYLYGLEDESVQRP